MGQEQSSPRNAHTKIHHNGEQSVNKVNRRTHEFILSNGDLESIGDIGSVIQAIHTPVESSICCFPHIM